MEYDSADHFFSECRLNVLILKHVLGHVLGHVFKPQVFLRNFDRKQLFGTISVHVNFAHLI